MKELQDMLTKVGVAQVRAPKELAEALAKRAQRLRGAVAQRLEALPAEDAPGLRLEEQTLHHLLKLFGGLIPKMTHDDFADAYAQTVTYCLLAARWAGRRDLRALEEESQRTKGRDLRADEIEFFTLTYAKGHLPRTSPFLRAFAQVLFELDEEALLRWLIEDIVGLLAHVNVEDVFSRGDGLAVSDPVIHFYEDFLDKYDRALRNKLGVYYTPSEVVRFMVRAADDWVRATYKLEAGLASDVRWGEYLKSREAASAGITALPAGCGADDFVVTILDPATGTGTFLKHVIEHIAAYKAKQWAHPKYDAKRQSEWAKYVRDGLLPRLVGFELMMAPYVVCHLRLEILLRDVSGLKFTFEQDVFGQGDRLQVYMTNTLSARLALPAELAEVDRAFYDELMQAQAFKFDEAATVVIGNPPYRRLAGGDSEGAEWVLAPQAAQTGRAADKSMFDDMLDVAREHTIFSHHASLYDLYVYFWRWGLWKAFEQADKPALLTFITNGTWVSGPGFVGLRQLARQLADAARVVDLGGENRGANKEPNVFNIETPVAICALARGGASRRGEPAAALYRKIDGASGQAKLAQLEALEVWSAVDGGGWAAPPPDWREPLNPPRGGADWQDMPALIDLFPWQQPGCKFGRTWPIAPHPELLPKRWEKFLSGTEQERALWFQTAATGRNIYTQLSGMDRLVDLAAGADCPSVVRYGYRSFDRQWAFQDPRVTASERPALWSVFSHEQMYFSTMHTKLLGTGASLSVSVCVQDLDVFCGRGGKDIMPLYRDASAQEPNVTGGLLALLGRELGIAALSAEDLAAYVYALLSGLGYQERFAEELMTPGPRVPLTRDAGLWARAVEQGRWLLWLHTYAERFVDGAAGRGARVPLAEGLAWSAPVARMPETTRDVRYDAASKTLRVGDGVVEGVREEVWGFEVSGMQVVYKWLGYRTKKGAGKAASSKNPLDHIRMTEWPQEWSDELLELLSVLTLTMDRQAELRALLAAICEGPLIKASELPTPTAAERAVPRVAGAGEGR